MRPSGYYKGYVIVDQDIPDVVPSGPKKPGAFLAGLRGVKAQLFHGDYWQWGEPKRPETSGPQDGRGRRPYMVLAFHIGSCSRGGLATPRIESSADVN